MEVRTPDTMTLRRSTDSIDVRAVGEYTDRVREVLKDLADPGYGVRSVTLLRDFEGALVVLVEDPSQELPFDSLYVTDDGRVAQAGTNCPRYYDSLAELVEALDPPACETKPLGELDGGTRFEVDGFPEGVLAGRVEFPHEGDGLVHVLLDDMAEDEMSCVWPASLEVQVVKAR